MGTAADHRKTHGCSSHKEPSADAAVAGELHRRHQDSCANHALMRVPSDRPVGARTGQLSVYAPVVQVADCRRAAVGRRIRCGAPASSHPCPAGGMDRRPRRAVVCPRPGRPLQTHPGGDPRTRPCSALDQVKDQASGGRHAAPWGKRSQLSSRSFGLLSARKPDRPERRPRIKLARMHPSSRGAAHRHSAPPEARQDDRGEHRQTSSAQRHAGAGQQSAGRARASPVKFLGSRPQ